MTPPVVVVGASTSGLYAAHLLAAGGRDVTVIERAPKLAPQPRTLIVTSRMREFLPLDLGAGIVNEIDRFELYTDGRSAVVDLASPDLIVERSDLVQGLAAQAQASGATVRTGTKFVGLSPGDRGVYVRFHSDGTENQVEADAVVGADGTSSRVAATAGWERQDTVPLIQARVGLPADMRAGTVRVYFRPAETPYFYWLIPESESVGVLGLIGNNDARARSHLDAFIMERGLNALDYQAALIPRYRRWRPAHKKLGKGNVYLVGDAAGHVKVSTVGGIVTGFRGAQGAAESILTGRRSPHIRRLRSELDAHLWVRRAIHGFDQDDYSRLIDLLNDHTRRALGRHTRDESRRFLLSTIRAQPRLLLMAFRGLLSRNF